MTLHLQIFIGQMLLSKAMYKRGSIQAMLDEDEACKKKNISKNKCVNTQVMCISRNVKFLLY